MKAMEVGHFKGKIGKRDVITHATFGDDRLRGLGIAKLATGRISQFPFDLRRRPYKILALPCECVILKDTETFQVLFIISLFCAWNLTVVEINSGVHLLKH